MANTSSAKKAARQMIKRTEINKSRRSRAQSLRAQGRGGAGLRRQDRGHQRPGRRRADSHAHRPEGRDPQEIRLAQGFQAGCAGPGAGLNGGHIFRIWRCRQIDMLWRESRIQSRKSEEQRRDPESTRLQAVAQPDRHRTTRKETPRELPRQDINVVHTTLECFTLFTMSKRANSLWNLCAFSPAFAASGTGFPPSLCKPQLRRSRPSPVARPSPLLYDKRRRATENRTRPSDCAEVLRVGLVCVPSGPLTVGCQKSSDSA